jgi:hypothetical protein
MLYPEAAIVADLCRDLILAFLRLLRLSGRDEAFRAYVRGEPDALSSDPLSASHPVTNI